MNTEPICLVCSKQTPKMLNLYSCDDEVATVFTLLTEIAITENDYLCRSCNNQLQIACEFREKCLTSELCLIRQIKQQQEVTAVEEIEMEMPEQKFEDQKGEMIEEWVEGDEPMYEIAEMVEIKPETQNDYLEPYIDEHFITIQEEEEEEEGGGEQELVTEKRFQCLKCNKSFKRNDRLKDHLNLHTNTFYKCEYEGCTKQYWNKQSLFSHLETHKMEPNKCDFCEKILTTKAALRSHIRQVHLESMEDHRCEECGKNFKNHKMLYCHRQTHIREKNYECPICLKKFISNAKLNRHKIQVHSTDEDCKYKCDFCSYSTASRFNFKRHQNKHVHIKLEGEN